MPPARRFARGAAPAAAACACIAEFKRALAVGGRDPAGRRPGRDRARATRRPAPRRSRCSPTRRSSAAALGDLRRRARRRRRCRSCARTSSSTRYQVVEARAAGADAVLLIVRRARPTPTLRALLAAARARSGSTRWSRRTTTPRSSAALAAGARASSASTTATCAPSTIDLALTARAAPRAAGRRASSSPRAASAPPRDVGALARRRRRRHPGRRGADARARSRARRCAALAGVSMTFDQDLRHHARSTTRAPASTPAPTRSASTSGRARKRYVDRRTRRAIAARGRRPACARVGVFVDAERGGGRARVRAGSASICVQLHGDEPPELLPSASPAAASRRSRLRDAPIARGARRSTGCDLAARSTPTRRLRRLGPARSTGRAARPRRAAARRVILAGGLDARERGGGDRAPCAPTASTSPAASSARRA